MMRDQFETPSSLQPSGTTTVVLLVCGLIAVGAGLGRAFARTRTEWQEWLPFCTFIAGGLSAVAALFPFSGFFGTEGEDFSDLWALGAELALLGGLGVSVTSFFDLASHHR
jgi:hypothetical protein